jgi:hypothetical protein
MAKYITVAEKIGQWLVEEGKTLSILTCFYNKPEGGKSEIQSTRLNDGKQWTADLLADLMIGRAEQSVQDKGGIKHEFDIEAYFDNNARSGAHHLFYVQDGELLSGGTARNITDAPNAQGLVAMAMNNMSKAYAMIENMAKWSVESSIKREENYLKREREMHSELFDAYKIVREQMLQQEASGHEMRLKELQVKKSLQLQQELLKLSPLLLNTLSGQDLMPQQSADSVIVESMAEVLTPEMINGLVAGGIIPQEKAALLTMRLAQINEKKLAEANALREMPATEDDPLSTMNNVTPIKSALSK